jgi:XXXCH domain-containing protein
MRRAAMGDRIEKKFGRLELADFLEGLSKQLKNGTIEAGGRTWTVPETIEARVQFKEKKGRLVTKMGWRWASIGDYEKTDREEVTRWKTSFKTVKKQLTASFKGLQRSVAGGKLPDEKILQSFVEQSQAFSDMAEPDWKEAMQEFLDHLENLQWAAKAGQIEVLEHEMRDMRNRMRECHREFK